MTKTIGFVSVFVPTDKFKKKYEFGRFTICHFGEVLDEELGAYRCHECSVPTSDYDEEYVSEQYAKFLKALADSELSIAKTQKIVEIENYDMSPKVNGFILNGVEAWLDKGTRVGLMNSTTIAKNAGHETTTLWFGDKKIEVGCDKAIALLSALEMYALECFNVTAAHKKIVEELTDIDGVSAFDVTSDYPERLIMEV